MEVMTKPPLKIGVRQGGGPPPSSQWNVWIIDLAFDEAVKTVGEVGYAQEAMQIRELAMQETLEGCDTIDVKPVEDFFEVRDRGGPPGNANVRLFHGVDDAARAIIPLGVIKTQNDGKTPPGDLIRMRRRWRNSKKGDDGSVSP
jgi:hypothetical protein